VPVPHTNPRNLSYNNRHTRRERWERWKRV